MSGCLPGIFLLGGVIKCDRDPLNESVVLTTKCREENKVLTSLGRAMMDKRQERSGEKRTRDLKRRDSDPMLLGAGMSIHTHCKHYKP